jgi:hypothetical protein
VVPERKGTDAFRGSFPGVHGGAGGESPVTGEWDGKEAGVGLAAAGRDADAMGAGAWRREWGIDRSAEIWLLDL